MSQQTDITSTSNVFEQIKRQLKLSDKPLILNCKCGTSSKDETVLYRTGHDEPLCEKCFKELEQTLKVKESKVNPEKYLHYCGIQGNDCKFSFDNFKETFPGLKTLKDYAESNKLYNMLMIGGTGVGKKHLAVSIIKRLMQRGVNYMKMHYITEDKFNFELLKAQDTGYKEVEKVWDYFRKFNLLIFDELGFKKPSESRIVNTTDLVNFYLSYEDKNLIVISNYGLDHIHKDYGDPLYSRLHLFKLIQIPKTVKDYRKKEGRSPF